MGDFDKFYNKALRFLGYRPRSEKEVRNFLVRKSSAERNVRDSGHGQNDEIASTIEKVITKLKDQNFINDEEFAKWWIESRLRFRPRAINLIKIELLQKGVSNDILESIIQNSEFRIQNDLEQAKKLIEKRIERFRGLSKRDVYQKLGSYLARRGFDWETIKKSIDEVLKKKV